MKGWKYGVLAVSLFLMFGNCLLPNMWGLNRTGMATVCIFVGTMLLMILCNLIWPLFLSIMAFIVNGVYTLNQALSISLGHNLMWFTVFCCMVLYVLREVGILRRMAIWLISRPIAQKSPWLFLGSIFLATMLMGYIMDCTALIILYASLVGQIFDELGINYGFAIIQSTQAAQTAEVKLLTLPTAAMKRNGECLAYLAVSRQFELIRKMNRVFAVEALMSAQGMDIVRMRVPECVFGKGSEAALARLRESVALQDRNRFVAPDMIAVEDLISGGALVQAVEDAVGRLQ